MKPYILITIIITTLCAGCGIGWLAKDYAVCKVSLAAFKLPIDYGDD